MSLDKVLCEFVVSLPSYLRDRSDLLKKLEGIILEEHAILALFDIEANQGVIVVDIMNLGHSMFLLLLILFLLGRVFPYTCILPTWAL